MSDSTRKSSRKRKSNYDIGGDDMDEDYEEPKEFPRPRKERDKDLFTPDQKRVKRSTPKQSKVVKEDDRKKHERTAYSQMKHQLAGIMQQMLNHKYAVPFLQPVDPVRDGAPDYFTRIKHPMDLGTINVKKAEIVKITVIS